VRHYDLAAALRDPAWRQTERPDAEEIEDALPDRATEARADLRLVLASMDTTRASIWDNLDVLAAVKRRDRELRAQLTTLYAERDALRAEIDELDTEADRGGKP